MLNTCEAWMETIN